MSAEDAGSNDPGPRDPDATTSTSSSSGSSGTLSSASSSGGTSSSGELTSSSGGSSGPTYAAKPPISLQSPDGGAASGVLTINISGDRLAVGMNNGQAAPEGMVTQFRKQPGWVAVSTSKKSLTQFGTSLAYWKEELFVPYGTGIVAAYTGNGSENWYQTKGSPNVFYTTSHASGGDKRLLFRGQLENGVDTVLDVIDSANSVLKVVEQPTEGVSFIAVAANDRWLYFDGADGGNLRVYEADSPTPSLSIAGAIATAALSEDTVVAFSKNLKLLVYRGDEATTLVAPENRAFTDSIAVCKDVGILATALEAPTQKTHVLRYNPNNLNAPPEDYPLEGDRAVVACSKDVFAALAFVNGGQARLHIFEKLSSAQ